MTVADERLPASMLRPESERVRLAQLARDVALRVPGVLDTDSGPGGAHVTRADGQSLGGVRCVATRHGGYEVSLRLICGLVPLTVLGTTVQTRVAAKAARAGLPVDSVHVHVAGVLETRQ